MSEIEGTRCEFGAVNMPGLRGTYAEEAPEGWSRPAHQPYTFIDDFIFRCERVAWGHLERPSYVLWEAHESFNPPESCRSPDFLNRFIATQWFSDAEFVDQAHSFGLPVFLGSFNLTIQDLPELKIWQWRWSAEGQGESSLNFNDNPPGVAVTFTTPFRFFWFTGGGVSYLDVEFVTEGNQASNPTASGTMAAPMLYAQGGNPAYAGAGVPAWNAYFSGTIHRFSDLLCEHPIES